MTQNLPPVLVFTGATATGKSGLAVELALQYNGEVISADSRQVYRGLDLGTEKITAEEKRGVPHYLLDIAEPQEQITAAVWKEQAEKAITEIRSRGKLPIVAGGTGLYIRILTENITPPEVEPRPQRRQELEQLTVQELGSLLSQLDPRRYKEIEKGNKRRLIRAIEIAETLGRVPTHEELKGEPRYRFLKIGLDLPGPELQEKISNRLLKTLEKGMIKEAQQLHRNGLTLSRMEELGLEYRYLARYLRNELSKEELKDELPWAVWRYAKRQKSWFRKEPDIIWFRPEQLAKIKEKINQFLNL